MFSFVLLAAVALLVVGILSVTAVHNLTPTVTPIFTSADYNQTYNFTIANGAGGATITEVRITRDDSFATVVCQAVPETWTCTQSGGNTYAEFTGGSIASGASQTFNISAVSAAGAKNYTFQIRTVDDAAAINTTGKVNVTVDAHPPMVDLVNVSDGTTVLSRNEMNGLFFLKNTTTGIVFVINATDNSSGMTDGKVNFYYNLSNLSVRSPLIIDYRNDTSANVTLFTASNGSYGEVGLYNVTLNISAMPTLNGTRVAFMIVANDSVHNGNVSNASVVTSSYVYNFTVDAVPPQFVDVVLTNGSEVNTNAINTTKVFGSTIEYIINSSLLLNLTVLVRDDGGAGTVKVEVMNRTGDFMLLDLITGVNGSSTQTIWKINATTNVSGGNGNYNITDIVTAFAGDGLYNITFRATDNVTNVNNTYNFTVEVDDTSPTAQVSSNISINGSTILSVGNVTLDNSTLNATAFVVRLQTSSNINNITSNISVFGNVGKVFNMTYSGGTAATTSFWNLTIANGTTANLSQFCNNLAGDGTSCNLSITFTDVLDRSPTAGVNLSIAVDGVAPNVSIDTPLSLLSNYSTSVTISVWVNDSVGPLQNVSFRLKNGTTAAGIEGYFNATHANVSNITNWIPMAFSTGGNSQFNAQGYWTATLNLSAQQFVDGTNYQIEINATDSAGRQNTTVNVSNVVFDSTSPQNISLLNPAANSFLNANFTVNINATERVAGLLNVSVRLENNTHNSPWVGVNQVISALASSTGDETVKFNASLFNLTHVYGWATNATNGNFTLRLNVTDTAGNQNTSVTLNLTIDTVLPAVSMVFPGNDQNQSTNFTVNVSVTESNINLVQYRWQNDSSDTVQGKNVGPWVSMNNLGGPTNWNSTFGNMSDSTNILDGNYTLQINVTDKAGNSNVSVYIQLLLDRSKPVIASVSSLSNSIQTADFVVNATVNDTYSLNMNLGKLSITNINGTASFRLENGSFNSNLVIMNFPVADLENSESNRTNGTFTFSSIANGNYDLRFFVNDTAGNQNSTFLVTNITLDNVAPSVAISILNVTPAPSGTTAVSGIMGFNVTVSDNLPLNISVLDQTAIQDMTYGVFYRLENSTFNNSWLPMSVRTNAGTANLTAVFNASNSTTTLADGDYRIRVNVTDRANNQNVSEWISISIQNGAAPNFDINATISGGYFSGSLINQSSPTFLINSSANATCRYVLDNADLNTYTKLGSTRNLNNNGSMQHNAVLGSLVDKASNGYTLSYACQANDGNYSVQNPGGAVKDLRFGIDTRGLWNVSIPGKTDNNWPNYFQAAPAGSANGWSSFVLSTGTLAATSLASTQGGYNFTNVLESLMKGTAEGNFTRIYAYTASTNSWETFIVGQGGNTFINFTNQTTYWINVTATERLEVN